MCFPLYMARVRALFRSRITETEAAFKQAGSEGRGPLLTNGIEVKEEESW